MLRKAPLAVVLVLLGFRQEDVSRQVSELIERLRSDEVDERDVAARKLRAIGKPAVDQLERVSTGDEVDLAARARELLRLIEEDAEPRPKPELLHPKNATLQATAVFKAKFHTSQGDFVVKATREWAPLGADRFYNLVKMGYYNDCRFFRVIHKFICQFGIHGNPEVSALWKNAKIDDDPVKQSNTRGRITFAMAGPNTRTTQLFISLADNGRLDGMGFAPFGEVVEGMDVVDRINPEFGEGAPRGHGPSQARIQTEGNKYLEEFSRLDYIKSAKIVD